MSKHDYQICWRGIFHDSSGYARAAREYVVALDAAGFDVRVEPLMFGTPDVGLTPATAEKIRALAAKPESGRPRVLIHHLQPHMLDAKAEKRKYAAVACYTALETSVAPAAWFPALNDYDCVIVPSRHNRDVLGADPRRRVAVHIAHHAANPDTFVPLGPGLKPPRQDDDLFRFLSVFTWQHRKAPEVLLTAFWEEFDADDGVELVIKTHAGFGPGSGLHIRHAISKLKEKLGVRNAAPVRINTEQLSDAEMAAMYRTCNAFVLPSRGEAAGLPYLEAIQMCLPVIATGWGGQMDFLHPENSYLVDCTLEPSTTRRDTAISHLFGTVYTPDMLWAEPSVPSLRARMRECRQETATRTVKCERAATDLGSVTWARAANEIEHAIKLLME